jgi:carbohydrate-binding DOMON domain-containing protein
MGNPDVYPPGTYTIWAESNVNQMNDNYDVQGKTISKKITLLNQGQNPLITKATTIATQITRTPTQSTIPATTQTLVSTTVSTPLPTETPTTAVTVVPSPSQTQAPGFGSTLVLSAILFGLVAFLKKE